MVRKLSSLLAAFVVVALLPLVGVRPAAALTRSNVMVTTSSLCGSVRLIVGLSGTAEQLTPRLPVQVYASAPERGLPRTLVRTISSLPGTSQLTAPLFTAAPSGLGPGVQVDLEWNGGTDSFLTEPYIDQCPGTLFSIPPERMLDTRTGQGTRAPGRVAVDTTLAVDPRPVAGVPGSGVTALVMNLTVTEPAAAGFVTAWPCGAERPLASNLNFSAGQTVANLVVVDVTGRSVTGAVCFSSSTAANLIADLTGYFVDDQDPLPVGGGLVSLDSPQRVLDTRTGAPPRSAGLVRRVQLGGRFGVPQTGVTAVALNVTALNALVPGYLTVFPCGTALPNASNVNYAVGRATPNAAIIGLGDTGEVCVFSETDVDVLVDITGYFSVAVRKNYQPMSPLRVVDTRRGTYLDPRPTAREKIEPGVVVPQRVFFAGDVTVVNVTATDVESDGWLAVFPCDRPVPTTSTLNFLAGDTVANTTIMRTNGSADLCIYSTSRLHLIIDLQGGISGWARFPAA